MCGCPWFSSTSPFTSTRTSSSFSFPSSPCTPTTLTPWQTTCATPPRGASSPTTTPSHSQDEEVIQVQKERRGHLSWILHTDGECGKEHVEECPSSQNKHCRVHGEVYGGMWPKVPCSFGIFRARFFFFLKNTRALTQYGSTHGDGTIEDASGRRESENGQVPKIRRGKGARAKWTC